MDSNSKEKKGKEPQRTCGKKVRFEHWHLIAMFLMIYDFLAINGSYFLGLWLRHDFQFSIIPREFVVAWIKFVPIYTVFSLVVFNWLRLYKSLWRFASYSELARIAAATLITSAFHMVAITLLFQRMPLSYYLAGPIFQFVALTVVRFFYRFILLERSRRENGQKVVVANRVMLVGAGAAGQMILRDLNNSHGKDRVCCIIDDCRNKWGRYIDGVPIVGGRDDILLNVAKYKIDKIYIAIPSATVEERRDILNICNEAGCELMNLPGLYELASKEVKAKTMKKVEVEDLLGRDPIQVDMEKIFSFLSGKVIMVTGGGGSIGSELCRQIAKHNPKQLIIFDMYENNAHAIQLELRDNYPDLNLEVLIGSVRDSSRINSVFEKYKPEVVYHAAAHKHVPLMEDSPCEAVKNNAIGTYKTAYAAMTHGCRRFVLISTDKAVNPTNIMGASKRLCEMVIQSFDRKIKEHQAENLPILRIRRDSVEPEEHVPTVDFSACKTEFVAVRFGNVLGSNGSVVPRFKEQIAKGGPVTVTHPDIIRYFMTIPEAASLVLQAGTYAKGGEIFVLDMGSPVKIDTLARNLIKLSGLKPDVDIQIAYTGLRPGEKLYEEKLMAEEGMRTTPNKLIHIGNPIPFDTDHFLGQLQELMWAAYEERIEDIRNLVEEVVPTFHPAGEHGCENKGSTYEKQMQSVRQRDLEQAGVH